MPLLPKGNYSRGQKDSEAGKVLALHVVEPSLIPGTPDSPLSTAKSDLRAAPGISLEHHCV